MHEEVSALAASASWKLASIMRTKRFFNDIELVNHYKAQVLSYIEYRTAAIYHVATTNLDTLDRVQTRVLTAVGMSEIEGLLVCRLAPLRARRDMAMLAVLHRRVLGRGRKNFVQLLPRLEADQRTRHTRLHAARHRLQLEERPNLPDYAARGLLGLVIVYSLLPRYIVEESADVTTFQRSLQALMIERAKGGCQDWAEMYSPRLARVSHPLLGLLM